MSRLLVAIAIVGGVISLYVGTLRSFSASSSSNGTFRVVQCSSPYAGAGKGLPPADREVCDTEASSRAETAGLIALGFFVGGILLYRIGRTKT